MIDLIHSFVDSFRTVFVTLIFWSFNALQWARRVCWRADLPPSWAYLTLSASCFFLFGASSRNLGACSREGEGHDFGATALEAKKNLESYIQMLCPLEGGSQLPTHLYLYHVKHEFMLESPTLIHCSPGHPRPSSCFSVNSLPTMRSLTCHPLTLWFKCGLQRDFLLRRTVWKVASRRRQTPLSQMIGVNTLSTTSCW